MAEAQQIEPQAAGPLTQAQISSFKEYEPSSVAPSSVRVPSSAPLTDSWRAGTAC